MTKTGGGQHNSTPKEIEKDCNSRGFEYDPTNNTCEPCPNDEQHTLTSDNRCVFTESSVSQMTSNITCGMKEKDRCTSPCQWDESAREGKGKCVAANATTSTEATAAASAAKAVADINIDIPCDRYNNAPEACGKTNGKCKWEKDTCIENKTEPTKSNNQNKTSDKCSSFCDSFTPNNDIVNVYRKNDKPTANSYTVSDSCISNAKCVAKIQQICDRLVDTKISFIPTSTITQSTAFTEQNRNTADSYVYGCRFKYDYYPNGNESGSGNSKSGYSERAIGPSHHNRTAAAAPTTVGVNDTETTRAEPINTISAKPTPSELSSNNTKTNEPVATAKPITPQDGQAEQNNSQKTNATSKSSTNDACNEICNTALKHFTDPAKDRPYLNGNQTQIKKCLSAEPCNTKLSEKCTSLVGKPWCVKDDCDSRVIVGASLAIYDDGSFACDISQGASAKAKQARSPAYATQTEAKRKACEGENFTKKSTGSYTAGHCVCNVNDFSGMENTTNDQGYEICACPYGTQLRGKKCVAIDGRTAGFKTEMADATTKALTTPKPKTTSPTNEALAQKINEIRNKI